MSITRQLIHRSYLVQDIAAFSVLKMTPQALKLLREEEQIELARPRIKEKTRKKPAIALELGPPDQELFEQLRTLRRELAEEAGVPPYIVFGDAALVEMSRAKPQNEEEFLAVNGVGKVKLDRYGEAFLEVIAAGS
jgi:ATP-dependent DNA helicase RecQ